MLKELLCGILLSLSIQAPLFAQNQSPYPAQQGQQQTNQTTTSPSQPDTSKPVEQKDGKTDPKFRHWDEYLVGTGGSVGALWNFGSGGEISLFRDDYNHEVTLSADLFDDRTSFSGKKLLAPILANYRWYVGPDPFRGAFINLGLGDAIPFGRDHGSGSLAWEAGFGYKVSKKITLELRYIGRQSQQVTNGINTFTTNNSFIGGKGNNHHRPLIFRTRR